MITLAEAPCDSCDSCGGCDSCGSGCNAGGCHHCGLLNDCPLGGRAALHGPYIYRYNCFGWREGPLTYYGHCCCCYEHYIWGHFDDRGPLNQGQIVGAMHRYPYVPAAPAAENGDEPPAPMVEEPAPSAKRPVIKTINLRR